MIKNDGLEDLVSGFVQQLREVIRRQALEAIHDSLSGRGARAASAPAPRNGSRRKGQKRDPGALEALQVKFLSFVAKHPGLRIEQINKQLSTTTKDLQLPIRKLIADGKLKAKGTKRSTTYALKSRKS
jgi:hypothetical protein